MAKLLHWLGKEIDKAIPGNQEWLHNGSAPKQVVQQAIGQVGHAVQQAAPQVQNAVIRRAAPAVGRAIDQGVNSVIHSNPALGAVVDTGRFALPNQVKQAIPKPSQVVAGTLQAPVQAGIRATNSVMGAPKYTPNTELSKFLAGNKPVGQFKDYTKENLGFKTGNNTLDTALGIGGSVLDVLPQALPKQTAKGGIKATEATAKEIASGLPQLKNERGYWAPLEATNFDKYAKQGKPVVNFPDGHKAIAISDQKAKIKPQGAQALAQGHEIHLDDVLDHKQMKQDLPILFSKEGTGGVKVALSAENPNARAFFDPNTNTVKLNPEILGWKRGTEVTPAVRARLEKAVQTPQGKQVLSHEISHAIDEHVNVGGTSPVDVVNTLRMRLGREPSKQEVTELYSRTGSEQRALAAEIHGRTQAELDQNPLQVESVQGIRSTGDREPLLAMKELHPENLHVGEATPASSANLDDMKDVGQALAKTRQYIKRTQGHVKENPATKEQLAQHLEALKNDERALAERYGELKAPPPKSPKPPAAKSDLPSLPTINTSKVPLRDKMWRSTRSVIERQGQYGKKLGGMLQQSRDTEELFQAKLIQQLPTVLKLKGKNFENFVEATQGKTVPINPKVAQAVKEWQSTHPQIRDRAVAAGLDVGDLGPTYYPHFIDYDRVFKDQNTYNKAINHLVETGQATSQEEAIKLLSYARDVSRNRAFGNLEASRTVDLPFYDKTTNSLKSYLQSSARRIAQTETFGAKDEEALKLITKAGNEGHDTEAMKNAYDVAVGAKKYNETGEAFSRGVRRYITTTRLGLGALTNASQSVNTGIVAGHLRTMGAMLKQLDPKTRQFVQETGTISDAILNDLRSQSGFESMGKSIAGKVANKITAPGFAKVENFNRSVASTAGRDYGLRLAQKGDDKTLRRLGVTGDIKNKTLTHDQQIQVARKVVEKTQFKVDPQDLPGWVDSPGGKLVAQFRTFSYQQGKFFSNEILKPAAKGNLLPFGRLLAVMPVGYGLYEVRRKIDGRPEEENKGRVALEAFSKLGGAGLAVDLFRGVFPLNGKYVPTDRRVSMATGTIGGPAVGVATQGIGAASEAIQRKKIPEKGLDGKLAVGKTDKYTDLTSLARFGISQVPVVGSPIKNRLLPYKKEAIGAGVATEDEKRSGFLDGVATYAKAIGTDPATAMNRILSGQNIRRVDSGAIIVERMSQEDSQAVKKALGGDKSSLKLDHTVPLQLGGSNDRKNLELVPTDKWASYTPVENYLGKLLRDKKINKDKAQSLIKDYKGGKITADQVFATDTSVKPGSVSQVEEEDTQGKPKKSKAIGLSNGLDKESKTVLDSYNSMDSESRKSFTANPKNKYKVDAAKYENDVKAGKYNDVEKATKEKSLAKQKITSDYSEEVVDFYGLSRTAKDDYFRRDQAKAKELYGQAKDLASKLAGAGLDSKKFAADTGSGRKPTSKGRRVARAKKGRTLKTKSQISDLASITAGSKLARKATLKTKSGSMPKFTAKKSTTPKIAKIKMKNKTA